MVDTPEGRGKVVSTQMLRGTCKVQLDDSPEHSLTEFQCTQCCMVKGACRNRQYSYVRLSIDRCTATYV